MQSYPDWLICVQSVDGARTSLLRHRPRSRPFCVTAPVYLPFLKPRLSRSLYHAAVILYLIMSFTEIPLLDLSLARNESTKPAFLESLQDALLDVGFLYIKNTGIDDSLVHDVIEQGKAFFDLPDEKLEIQMQNKPSFLGMSTRAALPFGLLSANDVSTRLQQTRQRDNSAPNRLARADRSLNPSSPSYILFTSLPQSPLSQPMARSLIPPFLPSHLRRLHRAHVSHLHRIHIPNSRIPPPPTHSLRPLLRRRPRTQAENRQIPGHVFPPHLEPEPRRRAA